MAHAAMSRAPEPDSKAVLEQDQLTHRQVMIVFAGLMLGMLVAALSQTVVATALPTIVGELGGQDKLSWVVSATLLTATASVPLWGKLSDLYGRKKLFQIAIVVYLVGSVACGISQTIAQLIGSRALQGLGTGGLMALAQAIIGDVVSPRERGRYQGYIGSVFGLSTIAGPLIGGFLVDSLSWRWCFFVGIPIGVVALLVTERALRLPFPRREHRIDWLGATLIVAGAGLILLVLSLGGKEFDWRSGWTYGLAAGGLAAVVLAGFVETRVAEPILPPRLFRNGTVTLTTVAGFVVGVAMFGAIIFLPQYLQIVKGQSPTRSGLLTLPLMIGLLVTSIGSGRVITRTGRYKIFPVVGMLVTAGGLYLFSRLDVDTSLVVACAYMAVLGLGLGLVMQVLVLVVQNAVAQSDLGVATATATFFRSMGGALGVAVFGAILTNRITDLLPDKLAAAGVPPAALAQAAGDDPAGLLGSPDQIAQLPAAIRGAILDSFAESLHTVFLIAIPFAVLGFILVLFLREHPLRTRLSPADGPAAAPAVPAPDGTADEEANGARGTAPPARESRIPSPVYAASPGPNGNGNGSRLGSAPALGVATSAVRPAVVIPPPTRIASPAPAVAGQVYGPDRSPLAGAVVTLTDQRGGQVDRSRTGVDGAYRLTPPRSGAYVLICMAEGHQPRADLVTVAEHPVRRDVELAARTRVTGTVRAAASGKAVEDAVVSLLDAEGSVVDTRVTGPDGTYRFEDVPEGPYTVTASGYPPVVESLRLEAGHPVSHDVVLGPTTGDAPAVDRDSSYAT